MIWRDVGIGRTILASLLHIPYTFGNGLCYNGGVTIQDIPSPHLHFEHFVFFSRLW